MTVATRVGTYLNHLQATYRRQLAGLVDGGGWTEELHDVLRSLDLSPEDVERDLGVIERHRGLAAEVGAFNEKEHEEKRHQLQTERAALNEQLGKLQTQVAQIESRQPAIRRRLSEIREARHELRCLRTANPRVFAADEAL